MLITDWFYIVFQSRSDDGVAPGDSRAENFIHARAARRSNYVVSSTNTVAIGSIACFGNSTSILDALFVIFSGFFEASASRKPPTTLRGTRSRWKVPPGHLKSSM